MLKKSLYLVTVPVLLIILFVEFVMKLVTTLLSVFCYVMSALLLLSAIIARIIGYGTAAELWRLVCVAFFFFLVPIVCGMLLGLVSVIREKMQI